jgi:hypothetical protein
MDIHKTEKRIPSKFIYSRIFFFALLFLLSVSGVFYTWNTFNNHLVTQEQEAVLLAKSASSLIPKSYLKALDNDLSDLNKSEYLSIKNSLMDFVKTSDRIRFAYFMMMQNGNIVFAADSEPSDSLDYLFQDRYILKQRHGILYHSNRKHHPYRNLSKIAGADG